MRFRYMLISTLCFLLSFKASMFAGGDVLDKGGHYFNLSFNRIKDDQIYDNNWDKLDLEDLKFSKLNFSYGFGASDNITLYFALPLVLNELDAKEESPLHSRKTERLGDIRVGLIRNFVLIPWTISASVEFKYATDYNPNSLTSPGDGQNDISLGLLTCYDIGPYTLGLDAFFRYRMDNNEAFEPFSKEDSNPAHQIDLFLELLYNGNRYITPGLSFIFVNALGGNAGIDPPHAEDPFPGNEEDFFFAQGSVTVPLPRDFSLSLYCGKALKGKNTNSGIDFGIGISKYLTTRE